MAKLPPPILEGTLPAFYKDKNGMVKITIPFTMNRGVSPTQVGGFALKIKTSQSSLYLFDKQVSERDTIPGYDINNLNKVSFILTESEVKQLRFGQFYKIQLAYLDRAPMVDGEYDYEAMIDTDAMTSALNEVQRDAFDNIEEYESFLDSIRQSYAENPIRYYPEQEVGFYSSIGVAKFTTCPDVYIKGLSHGLINQHVYNYTGVYSQEDILNDKGGIQERRDRTERVSSYYFKVYNDKDEVILDSGELTHNSSKDTSTDSSSDVFSLPRDLDLDKSYYIQYGVTTVNGLSIATPKYRIMQKLSIDPEIEAILHADINNENGYVDVYLEGKKDDNGKEIPTTGAFLLSRASSDTNFKGWEQIARFKLTAQYPTQSLWRDFTIEQGKTYKYSIQQYNDVGLYSNRLYSNDVYADFDYAFLYDGKRQLKIKFNSKVSSLKKTVQETKIDTIGSQYPFIFRNGNVQYHEFPISGLVSYLMDEEGLFLSEEEFVAEEKTTLPTAENIHAERLFKLKVLEWLTDGNVKLFRSPVEGNYIVRLMNTSFSPSDPLGRMLHTFSCTAYEIADYNYEELNKYGFLSIDDPECPVLQFETIELRRKQGPMDTAITKTSGKLNNHPAYQLQIIDVMPGNQFILTFEDGVKETITIGVTGAYQLDTNRAIAGIEIPEGLKYHQGSVTYGYYTLYESKFNKIHNVLVSEVPSHQFIGDHDMLQAIEYIKDENDNWIKNPKVDILKIYSITAAKRAIVETRRDKDEYYTQENEKITSFNTYNLYGYGNWRAIGQYSPYITEYEFIPAGYHDFENGKDYSVAAYNGKPLQAMIQVGNNIVSLENELKPFVMENLDHPGILKVGNAAMADISYQVRTIEYIVENDERYTVKKFKEDYENKKKALEDAMGEEWKEFDGTGANEKGQTFEQWGASIAKKEELLRVAVRNAYRLYVLELIKVLKEMEG